MSSTLAVDSPHDDATAASSISQQLLSVMETNGSPGAAEETFKIPALPFAGVAPSVPATGYSADIEHIIASGLNQPDPHDKAAAGAGTGGNYEEAVKALRQKAGFASSLADGGAAHERDLDMEEIEKEMAMGGVTRRGDESKVVHEEEEEKDSEMKDAAAASSDASSSSDSDGSNHDSDDDVTAALQPNQLRIPAKSSAVTATTSACDGKKRNRKRAGKAGRAQQESDEDDSGLSDDDINASSTAAARTEHEVDAPAIELPKMTSIPAEADILPFGKVSSVIDTVVVVKADTAGDWRVLDEGSLCCWEDRTVIGNIFETFGSVLSPFYSLRFPASSLPSPSVFAIGKQVYYAPHLSSFVFTRDLRKLKGSDASNVWDEEVGAAEMEWSDDEAEMESKRGAKAERRARTASITPGPSSRPSQSTLAAIAASSRSPASQRIPPTPHGLPSRPLISYQDQDAPPSQRPQSALIASTSSSSSSAATPSSSSSAPFSLSHGTRQMFERNTFRRESGGEFEFDRENDEDDDEGSETGSISSTFEVDERYREMDEAAAAARAATAASDSTRGRGGAARGRGGNERGGRGATRGGRGGPDDRGRGRGRGRENNYAAPSTRGGRDDRPLAGLPRTNGLPDRPLLSATDPSSATTTLEAERSSVGGISMGMSMQQQHHQQPMTFSAPLTNYSSLLPPPPSSSPSPSFAPSPLAMATQPSFYHPSNPYPQPQQQQQQQQFNFSAMTQPSAAGGYNPTSPQIHPQPAPPPPSFGHFPSYPSPQQQQPYQLPYQYQYQQQQRRASEQFAAPFSPSAPYPHLQQHHGYSPLTPSLPSPLSLSTENGTGASGGHFNPRFFAHPPPPHSPYGYPMQEQIARPPAPPGGYERYDPTMLMGGSAAADAWTGAASMMVGRTEPAAAAAQIGEAVKGGTGAGTTMKGDYVRRSS